LKQGFTLRLENLKEGISRSEYLYRMLAAEIVDGALPPSEHLDEASIAKRFDVSRTPVREALQALISSGLAFRVRHSGVLVTSFGRNELNDMFEVMADVEALCAGYAAERMTPKERYALDALHRTSAELVRDGGPVAYAQFNTRFHGDIYRGAHNNFLAESAHATRRRLNPFRRAQFRLDRRMGESFEEHQQVVDAIMRGDADGARAAMRSHVRVVGEASEQFASERPESEEHLPENPYDLEKQYDGPDRNPDQDIAPEETDT
jgi:DNA-binding GntR family transcriptional regulator